MHAGALEWRFEARPGPLSRAYTARIDYRQDDIPRVVLEQPDLRLLAGGRPLPHVYGERPVRLCLYLPGAFEWTGDMRLNDTIVPWTALWLFYFEEWLWSDDWKGGGMHPGDADVPRRRWRRLPK